VQPNAAQFQRPAHEADCQPHFPPSFNLTEPAQDPVSLTNRNDFFFLHLNRFETATQGLKIKKQVLQGW
jgi:hypothetical protein